MSKKAVTIDDCIMYLEDYDLFQKGVMYELSCKLPGGRIATLQGVYCERENQNTNFCFGIAAGKDYSLFVTNTKGDYPLQKILNDNFTKHENTNLYWGFINKDKCGHLVVFDPNVPKCVMLYPTKISNVKPQITILNSVAWNVKPILLGIEDKNISTEIVSKLNVQNTQELKTLSNYCIFGPPYNIPDWLPDTFYELTEEHPTPIEKSPITIRQKVSILKHILRMRLPSSTSQNVAVQKITNSNTINDIAKSMKPSNVGIVTNSFSSLTKQNRQKIIGMAQPQSENNSTTGGSKHKEYKLYNKRKYVVRKGTRGGKFIQVGDKKIYLKN